MSKYKNLDDFEDASEAIGSPEIKEGHKDYNKNLEDAKNFIINFTPKLLPGMKMYIGDGQWVKDMILFIVFIPKDEKYCGRFANPINLHQPSRDFRKECLGAFNAVYKKAMQHQ